MHQDGGASIPGFEQHAVRCAAPFQGIFQLKTKTLGAETPQADYTGVDGVLDRATPFSSSGHARPRSLSNLGVLFTGQSVFTGKLFGPHGRCWFVSADYDAVGIGVPALARDSLIHAPDRVVERWRSRLFDHCL